MYVWKLLSGIMYCTCDSSLAKAYKRHHSARCTSGKDHCSKTNITYVNALEALSLRT